MNGILHKIGKFGLVWRLLIFAIILVALVSPLMILSNSLLQFLFGAIILTGLLIAWSRRVDGHSVRQYGLDASIAMGAELAIGLIIGFLSVGLMFLLVAFPSGLNRLSFQNQIFNAAFGLFFLKSALVAYWEETIFRGFLLVNFRDKFSCGFGKIGGTIAAITTSSMLFGMIHIGTDHFSWLALAILTLNGVVWCIPMLLTGRLGMSIGLHASWNFSQSKVFGFAMSGNASQGALLNGELTGGDIWTGGAYGPEGGLLGGVGLIAMLALIIVYGFWSKNVRRIATRSVD